MKAVNARLDTRSNRESGFTYIGLLIFLVILGLTAAASVSIGSVMERRDAEEELLFVGKQFQAALLSYYNATPGGLPHYPKSLQDLLKDTRGPMMRRHIRRIYVDPISGTADWGTVVDKNNEIIGVYSPSDAEPIKIAEFDFELKHLEGKKHYHDWVFGHIVLPTS